MSFTALVVLHQSEDHLRRLLDSLERLSTAPQIVCVDSGSSDGGPALARARGCELLELPGNLGFGAANDAGLALARHRVTVLLNPDCLALDDGLTLLAARAAERDALFVPRLLDPDGSVQRSAHPLPATRATRFAAIVPPRLLPRPARERLEPHRSSRERVVGWAIAACVAARTGTLRRLGPFNAEAFLYYEDLDLCLRAGAAGVPTVLCPDVALVHVGGHATAPALGDAALDLQARRRRAVVAANLGPRALRRDDRDQALTFALRAAAGRRGERNRALLAALRAAQKSPS